MISRKQFSRFRKIQFLQVSRPLMSNQVKKKNIITFIPFWRVITNRLGIITFSGISIQPKHSHITFNKENKPKIRLFFFFKQKINVRLYHFLCQFLHLPYPDTDSISFSEWFGCNKLLHSSSSGSVLRVSVVILVFVKKIINFSRFSHNFFLCLVFTVSLKTVNVTGFFIYRFRHDSWNRK